MNYSLSGKPTANQALAYSSKGLGTANRVDARRMSGPQRAPSQISDTLESCFQVWCTRRRDHRIVGRDPARFLVATRLSWAGQLLQVWNRVNLGVRQIFPIDPLWSWQSCVRFKNGSWSDDKVDRNVMRKKRQLFVEHL